MTLLALKDAHLRFSAHKLLDGVSLEIRDGERIGLLGRNGAGKSTLLRVLLGLVELDAGEATRRGGISVAGLSQEVPGSFSGSAGDLLRREAAGLPSLPPWEAERRVATALRRFDLDGVACLSQASAGLRRRAMLAALAVSDPDLLLLDEPTNHLDIPGIRAIEEWLAERRGAAVFVTHDRRFLARVATRILDLDRGRLRSYSCGYAGYMQRREEESAEEEAAARKFDKKLAEEEVWIRRGVKAQRGRSEARIRALEAMREERRRRRTRTGVAKGGALEAERSGQLVWRGTGLGLFLGGRWLFRGLDLEVLRGDRIGIVGRNGAGKTSLLGLLTGEIPPSEGKLAAGANIEPGVFSQIHGDLDPAQPVMDAVLGGATSIPTPKGPRHVLGYLQDFLFTPEQARGPVGKLSGGERNRLALARILARPSNVLLLDEPTNDLDVETLEFLEDFLMDYPGTVLLSSHDREFLDQVVASVIVLDGKGGAKEYAGGFDDRYLEPREPPGPAAPDSAQPAASSKSRAASARRKLSFNERRELEALPGRIESLEAELKELGGRLSSPEFLRGDGGRIAAATARMSEIEAAVEGLMDRWVELESLAQDGM